jgi:capsular polysaccharide transport system permease protein
MIDLVKRNRLWQMAGVLIVLFTLYWGVLAAKRYVSESHIVVENLQGPAMPADLTTLLSGTSQSKDILLLQDYLLSADMLRVLEGKLGLRAHYSDSYDVLSRMLYKNIPSEWFLRHYQRRVEVEYDEYSGLLLVKAQAYTPAMAHAIASAMVQEGERFMNELARNLAREQVLFAEREVVEVNKRLLAARQALLVFQNKHGLSSPTATLENISIVAARIEGELSGLHARRRALESYLAPGAPGLIEINTQISALEEQLKAERTRLVATNGRSLNRVAEEYDRLQLEAGFQQDVYKTALAALERARIDATRTLKKVSVIQSPTVPEYSLEPARLYNIALFLIGTLVFTGVLNLLLIIIREHRD